ncbi:MAG: exosortase C-terminal domain/associated protein EpsI [Candidatus Binatia bacterium]
MRPVWLHYWISVAAVVAATPLPGLVASQTEMPLQRPLSEFAYAIGSWRGHDEYLSERVKQQLGTTDLLLREYVDDSGMAIDFYVSYFPRQRQGEASHSPKHCLPGGGWQPLREGHVPYPLADGDAQKINEILYERSGQRQLVLYWFRERGRIVASEYLVKWYLMWDALTRKRSDGALVRISTPVGDSEEAALQRCLDFARIAVPRLKGFFPD